MAGIEAEGPEREREGPSGEHPLARAEGPQHAISPAVHCVGQVIGDGGSVLGAVSFGVLPITNPEVSATMRSRSAVETPAAPG
jgi:hypothetical protein